MTVILTPSAACFNLIKGSEGCRLSAYPDPGTGGEPWTIGYGHTGPEVHKGLFWTQEKADTQLALDVAHTADAVEKMCEGFPTTQGQFDAMVSFAFNLGTHTLAGSTLLKYHMAGDYKDAALEFGKWCHAAGRVLPGLVRRRAAEAALYKSVA